VIFGAESADHQLGNLRERILGFKLLIDFVSSAPFCGLYAEMLELPEALRPEFVNSVWLRPEVLARRGIKMPAGICIQRSQFADRRPTLFCVTMIMAGDSWKKITITFDNNAEGFTPIDWSKLDNTAGNRLSLQHLF
jgi:hypothetical protein